MYIIPILLVFLSFFLTQSMAAGVLGICGFFLGVIINKAFYGHDKATYKQALLSFVTVFSVLIIFSLLRYFDIISEWGVFLQGEDETMFWQESEDGSNKSLKYLVQNDLIDNNYFENGLYYFYIRFLAFFATKFLDGNSVFYQLLGTSIPASIAAVFYFRILHQYIKDNVTNETIAFLLLSCIFPLSLIIHRDVLIALSFSVALYIVYCKPLKLVYIFLLALIAFATFYLREQSGLFIILLIAGNIWVKYERFRGPVALIFVIVIFVSISYVYYIIDSYQQTYEIYMGGKEELLRSSGLSAYVERLPSPLKETALLIQGQFQPLPIWAKFPERISFYKVLIGLIWAVISVYWFRVFVQSIWFVIVKRKHFPSMYIWMYLIFIIFLVLNISNADPRRMMCMYIIPFSVYVYNKKYISPKEVIRRFDIIYYTFVVILMLAIIIFKV